MNMAFQKLADISTAHLQDFTINGYMRDINCPITSYEYDYGRFVLVPDATLDIQNVPSDLIAVLEWALINNVQWIRFDCDAEVLPELPVYDWR